MVKSADRTVQIFEALSARGPMRHGDIVDLIGIPKSSATALLETLSRKGYLKLDAATRLYSLGPQIITLAGRCLTQMDIVQISQPILRELTRRLDEASMLFCRDGDEVMVIWREMCTQPLSYTMSLGERAILTSSTGGLSIMAYLPEAELAQMRRRLGLAPTEWQAVERQLQNIRKGGIAQLRNTMVDGVTAFGLPIFDHQGHVGAGITLAMPSNRFKAKSLSMIENELRDASMQISAQLGYRRAEPRLRQRAAR